MSPQDSPRCRVQPTARDIPRCPAHPRARARSGDRFWYPSQPDNAYLNAKLPRLGPIGRPAAASMAERPVTKRDFARSLDLDENRRPCGLMDKALVLGTKDCRFESCQGHNPNVALHIAPRWPWCLILPVCAVHDSCRNMIPPTGWGLSCIFCCDANSKTRGRMAGRGVEERRRRGWATSLNVPRCSPFCPPRNPSVGGNDV